MQDGGSGEKSDLFTSMAHVEYFIDECKYLRTKDVAASPRPSPSRKPKPPVKPTADKNVPLSGFLEKCYMVKRSYRVHGSTSRRQEGIFRDFSRPHLSVRGMSGATCPFPGRSRYVRHSLAFHKKRPRPTLPRRALLQSKQFSDSRGVRRIR